MDVIVHDNNKSKEFDFLIGYINKFTHKDPYTKKLFSPHPIENSVYQLLSDDNGYVIHTGKVNDNSNLQGIFIGPNLIGDGDGKWEYDITVLDKSNMLDYQLKSEDLKQIENWIDTNHEDLKKSLGLIGAPMETTLSKPISIQDIMPPFIQNALIAEDRKNLQHSKMSENLSKLLDKDPDMIDSLSLFIDYLTNKKSLLPLRSYILNSESPEPTIAASMQTLENYDETGDLTNIYKTIETCLFEVQKHL